MENATVHLQLAGKCCLVPSAYAKGQRVCPVSISPAFLFPLHLFHPAEAAALGSLMLPSCSHPEAEDRGAVLSLPLLLKKLLFSEGVEPALYVTVLPRGTVSGCSLAAMPRSLLVLASVCPSLLLCSHRMSSASHRSTTLAILQAVGLSSTCVTFLKCYV